jgi:hypothetical protein
MGRVREVTIKKFMFGTEEFRRANYSVMEGTPQECWDMFIKFIVFTKWISKAKINGSASGKVNFGRLQKNVINKEYWRFDESGNRIS